MSSKYLVITVISERHVDGVSQGTKTNADLEVKNTPSKKTSTSCTTEKYAPDAQTSSRALVGSNGTGMNDFLSKKLMQMVRHPGDNA